MIYIYDMENRVGLCTSFYAFCDWVNGIEDDVLGERAMLLPVYYAAFAHIYCGINSSAHASSFYNRLHMGRSLAEVRKDGGQKCPVNLLMVRDKLDAFLEGHPEFRDFLWGECIIEEEEEGGDTEEIATVLPQASSSPLLAAYAAKGSRGYPLPKCEFTYSSINICHFSLGLPPGAGGEIALDMRTIVAAVAMPRPALHIWRVQGEILPKDPETFALNSIPLGVTVHGGVIICGCADGTFTRLLGGAYQSTVADAAYYHHPVWAVSYAPMGYMWAMAGTRGRVTIWTDESILKTAPARILIARGDGRKRLGMGIYRAVRLWRMRSRCMLDVGPWLGVSHSHQAICGVRDNTDKPGSECRWLKARGVLLRWEDPYLEHREWPRGVSMARFLQYSHLLRGMGRWRPHSMPRHGRPCHCQ